MTYAAQYFRDEYVRLREMWGDVYESVDRIDRAVRGLFYIFANLDKSISDEEHENLAVTMDSALEEWSRRRVYMVLRECGETV